MLSMSKSLFRRLLKLFAITSSLTGGKYVTQAQDKRVVQHTQTLAQYNYFDFPLSLLLLSRCLCIYWNLSN